AWRSARSSTTLLGPSTTRWRTHVSAGPTRKVVLTSHLPRSRIWTGTAGSCRRLRPGFPAASGGSASTKHGRRCACRTPPRSRGAPRPLREDTREAPLVGLVRALPERPREGQQSGGGFSGRRPLHGGGSSCSCPITLFEWPHVPSGSPPGSVTVL